MRLRMGTPSGLTDIPAAAGTPLEIDTSERTVVRIYKCAAPIKVVMAASSAAAITALAADTGVSHLPAGQGTLDRLEYGYTTTNTKMYIEAESGGAITDGINYATGGWE